MNLLVINSKKFRKTHTIGIILNNWDIMEILKDIKIMEVGINFKINEITTGYMIEIKTTH